MHESAFGFSIPEENIETFLEYCDANLPEYEPTYHADFEITDVEDKGKVVSDSMELEHHVGPGFPQLVVYDEIIVRPSDIFIMGKNKNVLKINARGMEYIAFGFNGEIPLDISVWKIVGKPSINYFMGNATPQIKMDGWTIEPFEL